jgi:zinc protease
MSQNHIRRRPWSQAILDEMDLNKSFDIYKERFAEAGDFTFYFVGNFDPEQLKNLARTYLGSLPTIGREEEPQDIGVYPPKGIVDKTIYKGVEPKSQVQIIFTSPFEWSRENRLLMHALSEVLSIKLREVMREDLSGTYGVRVGASPSKFPREEYQFSISFGCDPERVEELTQTVFTQLDSLLTSGTTEEYVTKVRETTARQHEINLKENRYWLSRLSFSDTYEEDPILILEGSKDFMNRLTPAMIQEAARRYLNMDNYARFVLKPETSTEQ